MPTVKVIGINGSDLNETVARLGQVVQIISGTIPPISGTTLTPFDNTPPLVSEGFQVLSLNITPVAANSKFLLTTAFNLDHSNSNRNITVAAFLNGVITRTFSVNLPTGGRPIGAPIHLWLETLSLTPFTLTLRVGADAAGTTYLGNSPAANLGGNRSVPYTVLEILSA